ncbi:ribosome maturation factor RimP [Fibrobacterota bacterium]
MAESIAESKGLEIVDVMYSPSGRRGLLRVFIDKPGGVTIDDCSSLSRELDALMEAEGVVDEPYTLEVSSPGIDRPLTSEKDFIRNRGQNIKVKFKDHSNRVETLSGKLKEVESEFITVEANGQERCMPLNSIVKAQQEVQI